MPSTATITAFYTFTAATKIKSAEHNTNFSNFRGHLLPIDPNTATADTTKTYDLGATDHYWRNVYAGAFLGDTVSASTIVGTTITATSLVATTATVTTLQPTNIVQSTTTGIGISSLINLTSGQIKFPASQNASADANTLDDYEEGTWTPIDSSGAGLSLSVVRAKYTKIGRVVIASTDLQYPVTANGSTAVLGGFPFTVSNTSSGEGGVVTGSNGGLDITVQMQESTTTTIFRRNSTNTALTNANLSGIALKFVAIYTV